MLKRRLHSMALLFERLIGACLQGQLRSTGSTTPTKKSSSAPPSPNHPHPHPQQAACPACASSRTACTASSSSCTADAIGASTCSTCRVHAEALQPGCDAAIAVFSSDLKGHEHSTLMIGESEPGATGATLAPQSAAPGAAPTPPAAPLPPAPPSATSRAPARAAAPSPAAAAAVGAQLPTAGAPYLWPPATDICTPSSRAASGSDASEWAAHTMRLLSTAHTCLTGSHPEDTFGAGESDVPVSSVMRGPQGVGAPQSVRTPGHTSHTNQASRTSYTSHVTPAAFGGSRSAVVYGAASALGGSGSGRVAAPASPVGLRTLRLPSAPQLVHGLHRASPIGSICAVALLRSELMRGAGRVPGGGLPARGLHPSTASSPTADRTATGPGLIRNAPFSPHSPLPAVLPSLPAMRTAACPVQPVGSTAVWMGNGRSGSSGALPLEDAAQLVNGLVAGLMGARAADLQTAALHRTVSERAGGSRSPKQSHTLSSRLLRTAADVDTTTAYHAPAHNGSSSSSSTDRALRHVLATAHAAASKPSSRAAATGVGASQPSHGGIRRALSYSSLLSSSRALAAPKHHSVAVTQPAAEDLLLLPVQRTLSQPAGVLRRAATTICRVSEERVGDDEEGPQE